MAKRKTKVVKVVKKKGKKKAGVAKQQPLDVAAEESSAEQEEEQPEKVSDDAKSGVKRKRPAAQQDSLAEVASSLEAGRAAASSSSSAPAPAAAAGGLSGQAGLEAWLKSNGAAFDSLDLRPCSADSISFGMGAYAKQEVAAGGVAFSVPTRLMLTLDAAKQEPAVAKLAELLKKWKEKDMPELLICLRLCLASANKEDAFHAYAASLPEHPPGAASWPKNFRDVLLNTSLRATLEAADRELDGWEQLLKRAVAADAKAFLRKDAFRREKLEWARGMLQSRQFPGSFSGKADATVPCMVPLLDILNHKNDADITVKVRADMLEFICDEKVKRGDQIWNNYGSKGNAELLMCYGFAISDNPCDSISVALALPGGDTSELKLTPAGIPGDVIDEIENEQDTEKFVAILKAVLQRRRLVREALTKLPQALNFTVCKGPVNRARKRSIEYFLEGELQILEKCMEEMQEAENDFNAGNKDKEEEGDEGEAAEQDSQDAANEDAVSMDEDEALEMLAPKRKKRRRAKK
eukprot:TRINITY_DN92304_c0_g1_i1.p1 TRINITY_DN92304_c0_g1~~TRINITY_DN92304_c0_g1_i1.p1  ORF type:complete len:522 (+),score=193.44 TRINITY_DN92304_c0_g1_i1:66-1631(+)